MFWPSVGGNGWVYVCCGTNESAGEETREARVKVIEGQERVAGSATTGKVDKRSRAGNAKTRLMTGWSWDRDGQDRILLRLTLTSNKSKPNTPVCNINLNTAILNCASKLIYLRAYIVSQPFFILRPNLLLWRDNHSASALYSGGISSGAFQSLKVIV